jgi:hypothetical protein
MKRKAAIALAMLLLASRGMAQQPDAEKQSRKVTTPAALQAEIAALRVAKVAWREIAWKSCLIEGLKESREQKKPVLLWIFIDRPADDARC